MWCLKKIIKEKEEEDKEEEYKAAYEYILIRF